MCGALRGRRGEVFRSEEEQAAGGGHAAACRKMGDVGAAEGGIPGQSCGVALHRVEEAPEVFALLVGGGFEYLE